MIPTEKEPSIKTHTKLIPSDIQKFIKKNADLKRSHFFFCLFHPFQGEERRNGQGKRVEEGGGGQETEHSPCSL